jgi:hypothetical protein
MNKQKTDKNLDINFFSDMLSLKTDENVPTVSDNHKSLEKRLIFDGHQLPKRAGSGSVIKCWIQPSKGIRLKMLRIWNTGWNNRSH